MSNRVQWTCGVDGCDAKHYAKGWCYRHYGRWQRHGDPLGGRVDDGEPVRFINDIVIPHAGAECLQWPFATSSNGYGNLLFQGKRQSAHRLICRLVHGEPPTEKHETAHECGKRNCVNPRHLSWKTHKQNIDDKARHGTAQRGEAGSATKLTESEVKLIRALHFRVSQRKLAKQFGVTRGAISHIQSRISWAWLP